MVEKKQLGKGGNDMTNKIIFTLEINKDSLIIKVKQLYGLIGFFPMSLLNYYTI